MKIAGIVKDRTTYIILGAMILLGVLQGLDVFEISEAGWIVIGSIAGIRMRAGVKKAAKLTEEVMKYVAEERDKLKK